MNQFLDPGARRKDPPQVSVKHFPRILFLSFRYREAHEDFLS